MMNPDQLLSLLPKNLTDTIQAAYKNSLAPYELIINAMLATGALATQRRYKALSPDGILRPLCLNIITIAESGERKSSVDRMFTKQFLDQDVAIGEIHKEKSKTTFEKIYHEEKLKEFRSKVRKDLRKNKNQDSNKAEFENIQNSAPAEVKLNSIIYQHATVPALIEGLSAENASAALMSNEAGSILNGAAMQDLPLLNSLWDGEPISFKRKRPPANIQINNSRLSISLMTQLNPFRKFVKAENGKAMSVGFLARCLISCPATNQGNRFGKPTPEEKLVNDNTISTHNQMVADLYDSKGGPVVIKFSNQAARIYNEIATEVELALRPGGAFERHKGYGSKYCDNLTRVAAIIALLSEKTEVDEQSIKAADYLARHYSSEYLRLFSDCGMLNKHYETSENIKKYILEICQNYQTNHFKERDITYANFKTLGIKRSDFDGAVIVLIRSKFFEKCLLNKEAFFRVIGLTQFVENNTYFDFKEHSKKYIEIFYLKMHLANPIKQLPY